MYFLRVTTVVAQERSAAADVGLLGDSGVVPAVGFQRDSGVIRWGKISFLAS